MKNSNLFNLDDNFAATAHIMSIPIIKSKLDFVPKVTIAIPTYKRTELLKESIDSAINQINYSNYEIIVVDNDPERNCTTERLLLTLNEPRLSYYKNTENIGMVGNFNRMYLLAKGDYVVELHDDDLLYPDYLSFIMKYIKMSHEKYDSLYSDKTVYNMNYTSKIPERVTNNKIYVLELKVSDFLWENIVGSPEHIIKKQSFLKVGGYSNDFYPAIDQEFYVKFAHYFKSCKIINYPLSIYRICENMSGSRETLLGFVKSVSEISLNILELINFRILNFLWMHSYPVSAFELMHSGKTFFNIPEINVEKELLILGYRKNKFDLAVYKLIQYYQKYSFIFRRKIIKNHPL